MTPKITYRADIDGLRGIAVLAVLFFHADFTAFSGGFVGVDVFFVISGFLITSILHKDLQGNKFSIVSFYDRRVRRIFPALFFVLTVTSILSAFFLMPHEYKDFSQSLSAAVLFSSNLLFWKESNYFGEFAHLKPLLHTWSLAIEEQFYIFFPILLWVLYWRFKSKTAIWLLPLMLVSLSLSMYFSASHPESSFYLIHTRTWELLLGSLLALNIFPPLRAQRLIELLSLTGLTLVLAGFFAFSKNTIFPGSSALLPCVGTALLIYTGQNTNFVSRVISNRILVFVGLISYSLYLWHWPFIVFLKYRYLNQITLLGKSGIIALSIIASIFSWKYIEQPFRGANSKIQRGRLFLGAGVAMVIFFLIGVAGHLTHGLPQRFPVAQRNQILQNQKLAEEWLYPSECENFQRKISATNPVKFCYLGADSDNKIFFWGNSYIEQLYPALLQLAQENKTKQIVMATSGGCLPVKKLNRLKPGYDCPGFNESVLKRAKEKDIRSVVLNMDGLFELNSDTTPNFIPADESKKFNNYSEQVQFIKRNLLIDLQALKALGKKIFLILPFPVHKINIPYLVSRELLSGHKYTEFSLTLNDHYKFADTMAQALREISTQVAANLLDPAGFLCRSGTCNYEENRIILYRDHTHLTSGASKLLLPMLKEVFN